MLKELGPGEQTQTDGRRQQECDLGLSMMRDRLGSAKTIWCRAEMLCKRKLDPELGATQDGIEESIRYIATNFEVEGGRHPGLQIALPTVKLLLPLSC